MRCPPCFLCICATARWNNTGSRLMKLQHNQASRNDAKHSPDNNVDLFDQLRNSHLVAQVDEGDSRRTGVVGSKSCRFVEHFAC